MKAGWRKTLPGRLMLAGGSIQLGVGLMGAAVVYLSLASTMPGTVAGALGIALFDPEDPVELYRWGPFVGLCLALCANIALATLLRIPLRPRNLGAWITHTGLLVLAGAALWYVARSVSGDNLALRTADGWTPIECVYHKHTFAAYVTPAGADRPVITGLDGLLPRGPEVALNEPVATGIEGVDVRAKRFYPSAQVVSRWEDSSPNRIPAVQLRLADGSQAGTLVLSPSLPDCRQFGGRGYAMIYHAGLTPEALRRLVTPGGPDSGPGMPHDIALVLTGERIEPTLAVIRPDGTRWHARLEVGKTLRVPLAGRTVEVEPLRFFRHAARIYDIWRPDGNDPASAPADHEHPPAGPAGPVLQVEVVAGAFRRVTHVPFSAYQHLSPTQLVDLPGNRALWLGFSRMRTDLPATLKITRAEFVTYPGSQIPRDYVCDVEVVAGGTRRRETLNLNHPVHVGEFQFAQGSWAEDPRQPSRIYLIAASRPGLLGVWVGCALICAGFPVAFYLKPLLGRRRRQA